MSRTAAQQRYVERHREEINARERERRKSPVYKAHRLAQLSAYNNQRNSDLGWRWMKFSETFKCRLGFDYGDLRIVSQKVLECPEFIVVHNGKRQRERLYSPLPVW